MAAEPHDLVAPSELAKKLERQKAWRVANPERVAVWTRRNHLKTRYRITLEEYDRLLLEQDGKCAICRSASPGTRVKYFAVDHDHVTDEVRGLLCMDCNTGLGKLEGRLVEALAYLGRFRRDV